jgi:hypothetical protein
MKKMAVPIMIAIEKTVPKTAKIFFRFFRTRPPVLSPNVTCKLLVSPGKASYWAVYQQRNQFILQNISH